jgi:hypothetical protein
MSTARMIVARENESVKTETCSRTALTSTNCPRTKPGPPRNVRKSMFDVSYNPIDSHTFRGSQNREPSALALIVTTLSQPRPGRQIPGFLNLFIDISLNVLVGASACRIQALTS